MPQSNPTVVILGAGFGGLEATKTLGHAPVEIILIDQENCHCFQPLLYQVATAALILPGQFAIFCADRKTRQYLGEGDWH